MPHKVTRRIILQKARRHTVTGLLQEHGAPTACRYTVSGPFHSAFRGAFNLSLTVLNSLSVDHSYLVLESGLPGFRQGCSCPTLLRIGKRRPLYFTYGAVTLSGRPFQVVLLYIGLVTPCRLWDADPFLLQPRRCNAPKLAQRRFGLCPFRSPLLGASQLISVPPVTEMFHFTGFYLRPYFIQTEVHPPCGGAGFPIRKSPDQRLLPPPRSLSQVATSFFFNDRLGIPRTPLDT